MSYIRVHVPSVTLKYFDSRADYDDRKPYIGAAQWQIIDMMDGQKMAVASCHHADSLTKAHFAEVARILYGKFGVRILRTLRPGGKFVPRWRKITEGEFAGFSECILPDDVPQAFEDFGATVPTTGE